MNLQMAYLLGMYYGNGQMQRGNTETTVSIEIPHKKLLTESNDNVQIYVRASIEDIRNVLQPLLGTLLRSTNASNKTILSFTGENDNYIMREFSRLVDGCASCKYARITDEIRSFHREEKMNFLRGFADVTGYVRNSNRGFGLVENHRVFLEVPVNWYLAIDICNLLKDVDIPVETVDWGHPNTRDGNLQDYNLGKTTVWKREHQIKISVNEFQPIGFCIIHKQEALEQYIREQEEAFETKGKDIKNVKHKYYWEKHERRKIKLIHPGEQDEFIPEEIRGKHYDSWRDIAKDLGYGE